MEHIRPFLSESHIAERVSALGRQIAADYRERRPVVVAVLKGSFVFAADLIRAIEHPSLRVEFLAVRSYGEGTESSGVVQIVQDLTRPIADEDVILVEDIVDTGLTISYLLEMLATRKPASLKVCTLLHKPARARVQVPIDYLGFTIEDHFVIGYGLDHRERHRNLPYIGILEP